MPKWNDFFDEMFTKKSKERLQPSLLLKSTDFMSSNFICKDGFGRKMKQLSRGYKWPESDLNEHEMEWFMKDLEKIFEYNNK